MKETYIESTFCEWAECHEGWYTLKLRKRVGWPDRLVIGPCRKAYFIEFKRPGEEPELIQEFIHDILRALGFEIYVCEAIEQAKEIFRRNF